MVLGIQLEAATYMARSLSSVLRILRAYFLICRSGNDWIYKPSSISKGIRTRDLRGMSYPLLWQCWQTIKQELAFNYFPFFSLGHAAEQFLSLQLAWACLFSAFYLCMSVAWLLSMWSSSVCFMCLSLWGSALCLSPGRERERTQRELGFSLWELLLVICP